MQEEREDNKSFDDGFNSTDDNVTTGIEIDEYSFLETPKIVKEALQILFSFYKRFCRIILPTY